MVRPARPTPLPWGGAGVVVMIVSIGFRRGVRGDTLPDAESVTAGQLEMPHSAIATRRLTYASSPAIDRRRAEQTKEYENENTTKERTNKKTDLRAALQCTAR